MRFRSEGDVPPTVVLAGAPHGIRPDPATTTPAIFGLADVPLSSVPRKQPRYHVVGAILDRYAENAAPASAAVYNQPPDAIRGRLNAHTESPAHEGFPAQFDQKNRVIADRQRIRTRTRLRIAIDSHARVVRQGGQCGQESDRVETWAGDVEGDRVRAGIAVGVQDRLAKRAGTRIVRVGDREGRCQRIPRKG